MQDRVRCPSTLSNQLVAHIAALKGIGLRGNSTLNQYEDLPAAGPLQQFCFAESTVFRCFRCGDTMKSKLIHGVRWRAARGRYPPPLGHVSVRRALDWLNRKRTF